MEDFLSGCVGGMIGTFSVYPLDTWRIRKQTNVLNHKNIYSGVLSPLIGIGLEKAVVFGSYNLSKDIISNKFCNGLLSGFLASLVVTPVEKWKIIKQNTPELRYRQIIPQSLRQGIIPLYNGLSACFMREIPGYAIYFQTYYSLMRSNPLQHTILDHSSLITMIYGGLSGVSAWIFIYPFDVIKTQMQFNNSPFIQTTKELVRSGALYNGFGLGLSRAFLLHSFVFLGYETAKLSFNNHTTCTIDER